MNENMRNCFVIRFDQKPRQMRKILLTNKGWIRIRNVLFPTSKQLTNRCSFQTMNVDNHVDNDSLAYEAEKLSTQKLDNMLFIIKNVKKVK